MAAYEFIEHTGDLSLRAYGRDRPELFANAAAGMMTYLFGEAPTDGGPPASPGEAWRAGETEELSLTASDQAALFADWLAELLYRANTHYRVYFSPQFTELTDTSLKATIKSRPAEAKEDIKAVTYHDLKIEPTATGGWQATVVFDI